MFVAEVPINMFSERQWVIECLCMDIGLLPHSFPLPVYSEFPRELSADDYARRLEQMLGVTPCYFSRLRANSAESSAPAYVRPSWFVSQPIPPERETREGQPEAPPTRVYTIPSHGVCLFATDYLVFEGAMRSLSPSAETVGAGMLEVSVWFS